MNDDDYITVTSDDLLDLDLEDTISLTDWTSPLSTTLSASLGTSTYPATTITAGSVGATLSTTNAGLIWNNPTYTTSPYTVSNTTAGWTTYNQSNVLKVSGDAEFEGDVKVRGVSLDERLNAIEERLGILRPNNDLEGKWEKLKKLGEEYRQMEREILEQENMWNILKK